MKIKQLISLMLSLLIFGTRVGFALNVHYCGDRIAEVSFAFSTANCGMESKQDSTVPLKTEFSKKPCCKDNTILFQNHEPQKIHLGVSKGTAFYTKINLPFYTSYLKLRFVYKVFSNWNPPPPKSDKIFLVQQSFIFYD